MIDEIKKRATTWVPYELDENPFKDTPVEDLPFNSELPYDLKLL